MDESRGRRAAGTDGFHAGWCERSWWSWPDGLRRSRHPAAFQRRRISIARRALADLGAVLVRRAGGTVHHDLVPCWRTGGVHGEGRTRVASSILGRVRKPAGVRRLRRTTPAREQADGDGAYRWHLNDFRPTTCGAARRPLEACPCAASATNPGGLSCLSWTLPALHADDGRASKYRRTLYFASRSRGSLPGADEDGVRRSSFRQLGVGRCAQSDRRPASPDCRCRLAEAAGGCWCFPYGTRRRAKAEAGKAGVAAALLHAGENLRASRMPKD